MEIVSFYPSYLSFIPPSSYIRPDLDELGPFYQIDWKISDMRYTSFSGTGMGLGGITKRPRTLFWRPTYLWSYARV